MLEIHKLKEVILELATLELVIKLVSNSKKTVGL